ncbi:MAG: hypothetical protein QG639_387, partial [Patescibacteria group bacterium]|nr:hypothetical protein [Patescibacteria group bacterium]
GTNPEDLVLVPESIENEARLIRSLCDHYRASLNETLNATPEVDVQSVQDAINLFKLNYEELTVVLDRLLDTQTKLPPSKYSDNIKKANELFEAIKEAKSKIVTGLIMEAELKYDARIREESVTVPTGESVNDEPNIINFVKPNNGNEKGLTVEEINSKVADDFNTIEHQMANLEYSEDFLKVSVPARVKFEKIKGLLEEGNKLKNSTAKASSLTGPAMLSELKRRVDYFADFVDKLMLEFNELNKLMKSTENSSSIPFKKSPLTEAIEQIYVPTETNENDTDKLRNQIEEYANPPMATEPIATPETLDNEDVALDQETPKSEEKSIEKDIKWGLRFYGHWQNGNLDGVFRHKNQKWVEKETIVKIRQDIKITLEAAGYSEPEINNFFETKVNPWAEEVVDQRRTRKYQDIDHGALKGQIINAVREMIKDREPNPDVFRAHYESQGVGNTNQPAEVVGDLADSVVVDSLAENAEYTPISDGFAEDELVSPIGSEITDSEVLSGATVNFENLIKADELPVADSAAVAGAEAPQAGSTSEQPTPEAPSAVEAEITPELAEAKEAFMAEKSRHEELLEIVDINSGEQKDLPYLIDADLWRAGMVFKSVDSILTNPRYNDEERADKLRGPVTVLKEINKKIADILQQKSLLASPEAVATPEPVEETGSKDMPALEWSPTTPAVQAPEAPVPAMSPEAQASRERLIAAGINPDAQVRAESVKERHLEHREKIKEAKARMSELKAKHTNGLKDYYRNRGFLRKIGDGSRKLVGKGDFLPKELQELQSKSDQAADEYKTLISAKLEMRSGRATGSKYTPDNSSIISGLDERLVLDPYAEQTKVVQEAKAEQAADWPRINRIMTKMRDNPRATRAVSLAF